MSSREIRQSPRRRLRLRPLGWLVTLVAVFLLGLFTGLSLYRVQSRSSPPATPWWRTRFPPAAVSQQSSLPEVTVDPANVLPGVTCGNLDGSTQVDDGSIFFWGWAYDPRTRLPALAVVLMENGHQLSPPVHVFRERPDVVAFKGNPRLMLSGWNLWLPPGKLAAGEHEFEALALFEDHKLGRLGGKARVGNRGGANGDSP